jgi:hypothetical protein
MRPKIVVALLALSLMMAVRPTVAVTPQSDPSIQPFWNKFKTAVNKGDKEAVASMSKFPIEMPYGFPKIKTKAQLIKRYRELFSVQANALKCFGDAMPKVNDDDKNRFTVGCKDKAGNEVVVYGFLKTAGGWKLIFLDNINE